MRAGRPLRGPDLEGGGFAAARLRERAAAPGPGDAPREGTGPPLSVKAGCDRGATADRPAAWHMYTRGLALSAEPRAAPWGRKSGQAPGLPPPRRGASDDHSAPRTSRRQVSKGELAFDPQEEEQNYKNPLSVSVHGSRGLPATLWDALTARTALARDPAGQARLDDPGAVAELLEGAGVARGRHRLIGDRR